MNRFIFVVFEFAKHNSMPSIKMTRTAIAPILALIKKINSNKNQKNGSFSANKPEILPFLQPNLALTNTLR